MLICSEPPWNYICLKKKRKKEKKQGRRRMLGASSRTSGLNRGRSDEQRREMKERSGVLRGGGIFRKYTTATSSLHLSVVPVYASTNNMFSSGAQSLLQTLEWHFIMIAVWTLITFSLLFFSSQLWKATLTKKESFFFCVCILISTPQTLTRGTKYSTHRWIV